jgi:uncharacterized protein (UPF0332 family)
MELAVRRLAAARHCLSGGFPEEATVAAYYAIFNAARAALSEEDAYAKTHSGVWTLFSARFVKSNRIPAELSALGPAAQQQRQEVDYKLGGVTPEEAEALISDAERFVQAIQDLFAE